MSVDTSSFFIIVSNKRSFCFQFSNLVVDKLHLDELIDITHKFRRCPNTVHALPSTGHAVIRTFLDFKETDTLMKLLDDRLNYGLFLDYYLSNLLMDTFIKERNYRGKQLIDSIHIK